MRAAAVVALLLLAGCAGAPDAPAEPASDGGGRVARAGGQAGLGGDGNETVEMREIRILEERLEMVAQQGPVSFGVEVPPQVDRVIFHFAGSPTFQSVGLRIELTGCGAFDRGDLGVMGHTGGGIWNRLCGPAEAGAQTVSVSGDLVVFDGTFVLTAFVPLDSLNATAQA